MNKFAAIAATAAAIVVAAAPASAGAAIDTTAETFGCANATYKLNTYGTGIVTKTTVGLPKASTVKWYYNPAGAPANISESAMVESIKATFDKWTKGTTTCAKVTSFNTGLTWEYMGTTTNLSTATAADGQNVVGWFTDASNSYGDSTSYYNLARQVIEFDVRVNNAQGWLTPGAVCSTTNPNNLDLNGVLAHEIGHGFGLDHVGDTTYQTMRSAGYTACSTWKGTLGKGDIEGLKKLYNV